MTVKKTLASIALSGALTLFGFQGSGTNDGYQTIEGKPISVAVASPNYSYLSTVLDVEGDYVLAQAPRLNAQKYTNAAALIRSEISDGDKEAIQLKGKYNEDKFIFESVRANGYKIDFE